METDGTHKKADSGFTDGPSTVPSTSNDQQGMSLPSTSNEQSSQSTVQNDKPDTHSTGTSLEHPITTAKPYDGGNTRMRRFVARKQKSITILAFTLLFIATQLPPVLYSLSSRYGQLSSPDPLLAARAAAEWALLRAWLFANFAANVAVLYVTNQRFQKRVRCALKCRL